MASVPNSNEDASRKTIQQTVADTGFYQKLSGNASGKW